MQGTTTLHGRLQQRFRETARNDNSAWENVAEIERECKERQLFMGDCSRDLERLQGKTTLHGRLQQTLKETARNDNSAWENVAEIERECKEQQLCMGDYSRDLENARKDTSAWKIVAEIERDCKERQLCMGDYSRD